MASVSYPHIATNDQGIPYLEGTTIKVVEIVLDHLAHRWDAEEIHRQHPHLALGQIHSALAYYFDHQSDLDLVIDEQLREVESLRIQASASSVHARLRALGKLS